MPTCQNCRFLSPLGRCQRVKSPCYARQPLIIGVKLCGAYERVLEIAEAPK
jgi:hypothetical protein